MKKIYDTSKMEFVGLVIYHKEKNYKDDIERFYRKTYYYDNIENQFFEVIERGISLLKLVFPFRFITIINFIFDYEDLYPPEKIDYTDMINNLIAGGYNINNLNDRFLKMGW